MEPLLPNHGDRAFDPENDIDWWRSFPELNPNPVFEVRVEDHQITYGNSAAYNMIEALPPEAWVDFRKKLIDIHIGENHRDLANGLELPLLDGSFDVKSKAFEKYGTVRFFLNDLTMVNRARAEMSRAKLLAENLAQTKSAFLANMSHEIRTPINGVVGATELLLSEEMSESQTELLGIIYSSVKSLSTIINDVLDFSKIEENKVHVETIPFELNALVKEAVSLMELQAREKHIRLTANIRKNNFPDYEGDPTRIKQILLNLLSNAVKFTHEGGVEISVDSEPADKGFHRVIFKVSDTGIGIAENKIGEIFESFSQAQDDIARVYGGTGLGMTISRDLARLMGGDIEVESCIGEGSTFTFHLLLKPAQFNHLNESPKINDLTRNYEKKVLLAEDVKANAFLAAKILFTLGVDVHIVENGRDAIAAFDSSYDLVLMDMQMPVMNGVDAAKVMIKEGCSVPIIAVTANASAPDIQRCLEVGMQGHLAKPLFKRKLIEELDRFFL